MYHIFLIHSSVNGQLSCFHVLATELCCDEHWVYMYHIKNYVFLWIYAQEWDG